MKFAACCPAIAFACVAGCANVNPRVDYDRARAIVTEHTGQTDVYDPATDAMVDERVTALLADGLTLDKAVCITLLRNRGFQAMFDEIGASRADVVQSGLLTNPSVSLVMRFPEGGGRANMVVSFGQELVELWQIPVRKKIAAAQLDQMVWKVGQRSVELAGETKVRFYEVLVRREAERIIAESLSLVEQSFGVADARFRAGEVGRLDLNLARANLLDVRVELLNAHRDLRLAESALARVMGVSRRPESWTIADRLPTTRVLSALDADLTALAIAQRLDARVAGGAVRAADAEYQRQWLNIIPSLTAGAELERLERRALPGRKILADTARASARAGKLTAPDIQTRAERNLERRQIIDSIFGPSFSITLPLWDQNQAQIAKAAYIAEQKQKEYEDLLDAIAADVQSAAASARAASELIRFNEEQTLPLARQNVDSARRAYKAGEQSIILLIDAHESLIAQERAHLNALRDYATAWAQLEQAAGGRLPASMSMAAASAPASMPATQPQENTP